MPLPEPERTEYSLEERAALLTLAEHAVAYSARKETPLPLELEDFPERLCQRRATFLVRATIILSIGKIPHGHHF